MLLREEGDEKAVGGSRCSTEGGCFTLHTAACHADPDRFVYRGREMEDRMKRGEEAIGYIIAQGRQCHGQRLQREMSLVPPPFHMPRFQSTGVLLHKPRDSEFISNLSQQTHLLFNDYC